MKGIVVTTANKVYAKEFEEPLHKTLREVIGGYIEVVRPKGLKPPLCMIVDEEGILKGLPVNVLGSALYGTLEHGHPIVGDIVIMQEVTLNGERDISGFNNLDTETIMSEIPNLASGLLERMETEGSV